VYLDREIIAGIVDDMVSFAATLDEPVLKLLQAALFFWKPDPQQNENLKTQMTFLVDRSGIYDIEILNRATNAVDRCLDIPTIALRCQLKDNDLFPAEIYQSQVPAALDPGTVASAGSDLTDEIRQAAKTLQEKETADQESEDPRYSIDSIVMSALGGNR